MVKYLSYIMLVSKTTVGMYKIDKNSKLSIRLLHRCLRVLTNVALGLGFISMAVDMIRKGIVEIDKMAFEIMTMVIFFSALCRANYFYLREDHLEKVVSIINDKFMHTTSTGLEEMTLMKYHKITNIFVIIWGISVLFTGEFMALLPLTAIRKTGRILPLPLWYPYDWKPSPYYELTYFSQVLTQFFMAFSYGNSDMFYSCTTMMITGQFSLFGWELKNLVYAVLLKQGIPKALVLEFRSHFSGDSQLLNTPTSLTHLQVHEDILKVMETETFKNDLNRALKNCVKHHQVLLDACELMQNFFSPLLLPEMLFSIFYCIFIMYAIVVTTNMSTRSTLIEYLAMTYAQIFCVTYLGQKLFDQSEVLSEVAYEMPWTICDKNFKKTLNIMQMKLAKPVTITAWKFFDMKLTTFVYAVKTSFSFLAFLRQVTEVEENL